MSCSGALGSARSQTTPSAAPVAGTSELDAAGVAAADDDLRTLGGKQLGGDEPDPARRAGDDANSVGEPQIQGELAYSP